MNNGVIVAGIVGSSILGSALYSYKTRFETDVKVSSKYVKDFGKTGIKTYLITCHDDEKRRFKVSTGNPWLWIEESNSKDIKDVMVVGGKYHVKAYGMRIGFMDMNPIIYSISKKQ